MYIDKLWYRNIGIILLTRKTSGENVTTVKTCPKVYIA